MFDHTNHNRNHTHHSHTNAPKPYSNPFDPFNLHDPNDFYHNIPRGYTSPRANPAIIFAKPHTPTPEVRAKKQAYEAAEREAILANHKLMQAINGQAGTAGPTRPEFIAIKEHQEATRAHANALKEQLPPEPPQEPAELPVPYDHRPPRKYLRYEDIPVVTPENAGIPLHKLFPHLYPAPSEPCVVTESTETSNTTDPRGGMRKHASPTTNDPETQTRLIDCNNAMGEQITQAPTNPAPSLHAEPASQHPNQQNEGVIESPSAQLDDGNAHTPLHIPSESPTSSLHAEPVMRHVNQHNEGVMESSIAQPPHPTTTPPTPHTTTSNHRSSLLPAEPASQDLNQGTEGVVGSTPPTKPPFQGASPTPTPATTPITTPTPTTPITNTSLQNLLPSLSSIPTALITAVQHDHLLHNHTARTLSANHKADLPTILTIITAPNHQLLLQQLTDQQLSTIARSTQDLILQSHDAQSTFITDSLHPDFDPTAKPNIERRRTLSTLNATLRATSTALRTLFPTTHTPHTHNTKSDNTTAHKTNHTHKSPQPHWATLTPPHPNMQHPDDPTPNPNIAPNTKPTTWTTTLTPDQLAPIHDLQLLLSLFPPKR